MAPIVPDKKKIKSFPTEAAFEAWLAANHARETVLWLRLYDAPRAAARGRGEGRLSLGCGVRADALWRSRTASATGG
ncbi:hypothetical protein [Sorangium sp. So ce233]|uniref:hypothetical protein n=1 Tax=Sorangium sp. So ce233 TaxID=3133290 RepID=UPI003F5F6069